MNIMYARHDKASKISVLALDARKALDQVEWKYILSVIKEFDLGDTFAWIKIQYAHPTASVITNQERNHPIFHCIAPVAKAAH